MTHILNLKTYYPHTNEYICRYFILFKFFFTCMHKTVFQVGNFIPSKKTFVPVGFVRGSSKKKIDRTNPKNYRSVVGFAIRTYVYHTFFATLPWHKTPPMMKMTKINTTQRGSTLWQRLQGGGISSHLLLSSLW